MNDVPPLPIANLIDLGECGDTNSTQRDNILALLRPFERLNRLGWDEWSRVIEPLDEIRARNLVRGLAMGELLLDWAGGSAASVIWAFQVFQRRFPNSSDDLAEWILQHSENPYAPFCTMRAGIRSLSEYRAYLSAKAKRRIESQQKQERQKVHKQAKQSVRRRLNAERFFLWDAQHRARQHLIEELSTLPVTKRLEHIAWDGFHPLAFYPAGFANITMEELSQLDVETRQKLLDKMAARRKGVWARAFKQARNEFHTAD